MKVPTWWIGCNTLFNTKIQIFGSSTVEMNLTNHFRKCLEMQQYIFNMVNSLQNTWRKCKCLFAAENWKEYLWYFAQIYKSWTWWCGLTNLRIILDFFWKQHDISTYKQKVYRDFQNIVRKKYFWYFVQIYKKPTGGADRSTFMENQNGLCLQHQLFIKSWMDKKRFIAKSTY